MYRKIQSQSYTYTHPYTQILPKLPAPHKRLIRPPLLVTKLCSHSHETE